MVDGIVIVIIGLMAFFGWNSGLVRSFFRLGYYIISIIAAALLYPLISNLLAGSALREFIYTKVMLPRMAVDTTGMNLPSFMHGAVTEGINATSQNLALSATDMAINIICFIIVFLAVRIGLKFLSKILDAAAKLPVLNFINKTGGLALGVISGTLLVYILLAVSTLFMNEGIYSMISNSIFTISMYNNNPLLKLIM